MKLPPGVMDKRGLTWTCRACASTFMLEPMAYKKGQKGGQPAEITRCAMKDRHGKRCDLRYWHAGNGPYRPEVRQGIDPTWVTD